MSDRPTFSLLDDWAILADIDHITFRVYALIRSNAESGRNGLATHTLHVTASWVVDATRHWKKPMALSTVRKHMQKLVEAGLLARVNSPSEGFGVIYAFVADPGPEYEGPINGFEHAKRISRRKGTTSVYRRISPEGSGDAPRAVEVRRPKKEDFEGQEVFEEGLEPEPPRGLFEDHVDEQHEPPSSVEPDEEPEFDLSGLDEPTEPKTDVAPAVAEFAAELEFFTSQHSEEHLRLMAGVCRRVAKAYAPVLERGWSPKALAKRLSAELNPRVHSPEKLLISKMPDVGHPPVSQRKDGKLMVRGQVVDPAAFDFGFEPKTEELQASPSRPRSTSRSEAENRERLAKLARRARS